MRVAGLLLAALLSGCGSHRPDSAGERGGSGGFGLEAGGVSNATAADGGKCGHESGPEAGAAGRVEPDGAAGMSEAGEAGAAGMAASAGGVVSGGCSSPDPCPLDSAPQVHELVLCRIAFFQAVKVPVMEQMLEVTDRRAAVVSGRPGMLRAYVTPGTGWYERPVRARLTLMPSGPDPKSGQVIDQTQIIRGESSDANPGSTFDFEVPAALLSEGLAYSLELFETDPYALIAPPAKGARFPEAGQLLLGVQPASKLRVKIVPVEFDVGQTSLLPDTSVAQLERFRSQVTGLFPITGIDISVRDPALRTTSTDLVDVLDQVAALRDEENIDPEVSYFGVVRFTDAIEQYCNPSCVLGGSFTGTTPTGGVGVGVDYTGAKAASTFAHELGHIYGRSHTPCGVAGDPSFPYSGGRIGSWGYDVATKTLFDPAVYADFMGYCSPFWVSDFTYEHLREFISAIGLPPAMSGLQGYSLRAGLGFGRMRSLLLEPGRAPRWGLSRTMRSQVPGISEAAIAYDAAGAVADSLTVYRARGKDLEFQVVYVPEAALAPWASIAVAGQNPVPFPARLSALQIHSTL